MAAKSFRTKTNIKQAWNWLKSNPDGIIKDGYGMRDAYRNFTVVEENFLNEVVSDLRAGTYNPTSACKVYLPKSSGGLRPYTLLTVKDQVIYQALVNIVAEQLFFKIKNRYYDKVFGNLYGGNESIWFYKNWGVGYKKFNNAARRAFSSGRIFMASFDLVACYDSIDHKVLSYYLQEIGVPQDAIDLLLLCLSKWTSTDYAKPIYQGHGIPQGPMSSGLLSEVVLSAFDSERRTPRVTYIRYVDDIWFFAEEENDLREELVRMDRICKKVGLFPQSSKINIRRVKDIEEELKTVSGIFDNAIEIDNNDYFGILKKVTPSYRIKDVSKFKYCTSKTNPTSQLINRLWRIFANHPEIYPQICSAIIRSGKLSKTSRKNIRLILSRKNPYINIQASFVEVLCKIKMSLDDARIFSKIIKEQFGTGSAFRNSDARLTALVFEFLYINKKLTTKQISYICKSPFWYTRREIARFLKNSESSIIKNFLLDDVQDVQLSSSRNIMLNDTQVPSTSLPFLPNTYFKNFNLITGNTHDPCKIHLTLTLMIGQKINVNWKKLLGTRYKQALKVLVNCNASLSTNIGAWICELDVFNEIIVRALFDKETTLGVVGGNYGSVLGPGSPFAIRYNNIYSPCAFIHKRRRTTPVTHAYDIKTKQPTQPFKHKEVPVYMKKQIGMIMALSKSTFNL